MYVIAEIQGQQFKTEKDKKLYVHRLPHNEGETFEIDKVLLIEDGENILIGTPYVEGAKIKAKVLKHLKGDKVLVFKKKRRKGYKKLNGHRQQYSQILIEDIMLPGKASEQETEETKTAEENPEN